MAYDVTVLLRIGCTLLWNIEAIETGDELLGAKASGKGHVDFSIDYIGTNR